MDYGLTSKNPKNGRKGPYRAQDRMERFTGILKRQYDGNLRARCGIFAALNTSTSILYKPSTYTVKGIAKKGRRTKWISYCLGMRSRIRKWGKRKGERGREMEEGVGSMSLYLVCAPPPPPPELGAFSSPDRSNDGKLDFVSFYLLYRTGVSRAFFSPLLGGKGDGVRRGGGGFGAKKWQGNIFLLQYIRPST